MVLDMIFYKTNTKATFVPKVFSNFYEYYTQYLFKTQLIFLKGGGIWKRY